MRQTRTSLINPAPHDDPLRATTGRRATTVPRGPRNQRDKGRGTTTAFLFDRGHHVSDHKDGSEGGWDRLFHRNSL
jgi:hypothetical protein